MIGLLILFLIVCAFTSGYNFHKRRSVHYKQRWQEALALYEEERHKTLTLGIPSEAITADAQLFTPPKATQELFSTREFLRARGKDIRYQKGPNDAQRVLDTLRDSKFPKVHSSSEALKTLQRLSDYNRYQAEAARLDNQLPVIDDLSGMSDYYTTRMLQRRAGHGIG